MAIPVWDEFAHNSGHLFPLSISSQENRDTQEDYPSKGDSSPAIREMKVEQKVKELKGWKNVFQLSCCREERGFVPRFHVYKHTYNVQDGRNTPSLVAGEVTH